MKKPDPERKSLNPLARRVAEAERNRVKQPDLKQKVRELKELWAEWQQRQGRR